MPTVRNRLGCFNCPPEYMVEFPSERGGALLTKKEAKKLILARTGRPAVKAYKLFELSSTGLRPLHLEATDGIYVPGKMHVIPGNEPIVPNFRGYHAYRNWTNIGRFPTSAFCASMIYDNLTIVFHKVYLGDCVHDKDTNGITTAARYMYVGDRFTGANRRNTHSYHYYDDRLRLMIDEDGVCNWHLKFKATEYRTQRDYYGYTPPTDKLDLYTGGQFTQLPLDYLRTALNRGRDDNASSAPLQHTRQVQFFDERHRVVASFCC